MRIVLAALLIAAAAADPLAAAALTGRVIGSDGRPLAGATVSAYAREQPEDDAERRAAGRARAALGTARTAADGTFRIETASVVASIEARADGFAPAAASPDPDGPTVLTLAKAPLRRGVVRGGGRPLAGALVVWTAHSGAEIITRTASDGSYQAPDPAKVPGHLAIYHPGFAVLWDYANAGNAGLDRELAKGREVRGVVTGEGGRAVPNATLWLDGRIPAGRSDAKGAFRIEHAREEWEYVSARAGGLGGVTARKIGSLVIRVRPAASVSGVVRDTASGAPLSGAAVVATHAGLGDVSVSADTDARGQFAFKGLLPGRYRVYAGRKGYVSGPPDYMTAEPLDLRASPFARRDFALKAVPRARGRVVDPERRPVDGAMVAVGIKSTPNLYLRSAEGFGGDSTLTAPDGSFTLMLPDPTARESFDPFGKERPLVVLKEGFAAAQVEPAKAGGAAPLLVVLTRGVELSGRVTAADGAPLADVAVAAAEDGAFAGMAIPTHMVLGGPDVQGWTATDANGRFALRVHPTVHHLAFRKEGHAPKVVRGHDVRNGVPLAVVLDPAAVIRGRVVHADGRGVADVTVSVMDAATMSGRSETTAADGSFTIGDLARGQYQLTAIHAQLGVQEMRTVEAPAEAVQIVLDARGSVRGRVVEAATRRPVARFTVELTPVGDAGTGARSVPVEDAGGAFSIEHFPLGTAALTVKAEGYATRRIDDVAVTSDGEPPEIEVALEPEAAVVGRVSGERGAPVPQARLSVERDGASASVWAMSDDEGEFELHGLAPGEVTVRAEAAAFLPEKRTVDTRQRTRVDIVLRKGLALRGEVVAEGAGVPQAHVGARSGVSGATGQSAQTDERGRFTLEGLVPGRYTVWASAEGMGKATLEDVDVEQAGVLRITLERARTAVLSGKVVGLPAGDEPSMAMVMATGPDGASAQAMVDAAQTFRMEDAPAGRVQVRAVYATPTSSMRTSRTVELTLAPGSEAETVLEFASDVVIRGTVVRTGAPVTGAMVSFMASGRSEMGTMARTDARGAYEVVGLEPGPHKVHVYGNGISYSMDYAVTGSAELDIDVTGGTVTGRALRADNGAPVAGVQISFFALGGQANTPAQTATTNAQGGFAQGSLHEGRYRLVTAKAGFGQQQREVEVGRGAAAEVTFELQPAEGVSLSVVDARDGRPLDAIVVVRDQAKRIVANRHSGVGDDGVLNIPLADGSYILSTSATGYGTATLPVRSPSQGLKVGLTPGGTLRIESGRDLRGRVRLVQPDGEEYVRCWCNGIADIELGGRVTTVENVTPGTYTMEVVEAQGVSATRPVVIREGQVSAVTVE